MIMVMLMVVMMVAMAMVNVVDLVSGVNILLVQVGLVVLVSNDVKTSTYFSEQACHLMTSVQF